MTDTLPYDKRVSLYSDPHENLTIESCRVSTWPAERPDVIVVTQDEATVILDRRSAMLAAVAVLKRSGNINLRRAA